jgi:glycosyltransferase involved in cell wall biosynthesis
MNIEAMIISIDEPQLERNVAALNAQTVPFSKIIHINNVVPEYKAFNRGLELLSGDWVMKVDGDFILKPDTVETALKYINQGNHDGRIFAYHFGLIDTFLDVKMGFCSVFKTMVYRSVPYKDKFSDDIDAIQILRKKGWIDIKLLDDGVIVGTHFDKPDEFQVFVRFYLRGRRYKSNDSTIRKLGKLLHRTGDPLYSVALKAIEFGKENRDYPGSHNLDFNRKMYEKFRREYICQ